ncbi:hypothetical protein EJ06DRAFT_475551, partial [Trichodelitschia bisporula]
SRASSRTRTNDRLQDRLAKAVVKGGESSKAKSRTSSEIPSRAESPALAPRTSMDSKGSGAVPEQSAAPGAQSLASEETSTEATNVESAEALPSEAPASDASKLLSVRPSSEFARPSFDSAFPDPAHLDTSQSLHRSASFLELELSRATEAHDEAARNYQEELHSHLERIDALQSKLAYLASSASASARTAMQEASPGTLEKRLAEKDEKIAQLLEEGQKLSKSEMLHLATIRKLKSRAQEVEQSNTQLKNKLDKAERDSLEHKERGREAEARENTLLDKIKTLTKAEHEVESLRRDNDLATKEIAQLRRQLADSARRAEDAEHKAQAEKAEQQMRIIAELNDELSNARIEKRLVEDRAKAEVKEIRDEAARQQERVRLSEVQLRGEIHNLEAKLELLRVQTEEVSSSSTSDSQAKLLRQIETLQTQYAVASENWQGIEGMLNSRLAALEKERDEIAKREADVRKKAREVNSKYRRLEEELEVVNDQCRELEVELLEQKTNATKLQTRLSSAEAAFMDAKAEQDRMREAFEHDAQAKLEEERTKWRHETASPTSIPQTPTDGQFLRAESLTASFPHRKTSSTNILGLHSRRSNVGNPEISPLMDHVRPVSRRTSGQNVHHVFVMRTPTEMSTPVRQDSGSSIPHTNGGTPSFSLAPSIDIGDDTIDMESASSPHRTVNELVSVSTAGAGPSVQLVERMSAAVRRLETEKAASREEMARLIAQRDEAREEVVSLMRELEAFKDDKDKVAELETQIQEMNKRYDAALLLLGEKSEECEELRNDVQDLKKIYRELVESTLK